MYDSCFNPFDDLQAIDRCHRMGQTRDVHVFRLLGQGTIEERILEMVRALDHKKRLVQRLSDIANTPLPRCLATLLPAGARVGPC